MPNNFKNRKFILLLIIIMLLTCFSNSLIAEEDTLEEVEKKIQDISAEERIILEELFIKAQEIEELEWEKNDLIEEIRYIEKEVEALEQLIENETENYENKLNLLREVLVSYQKMGPSSFLEILLNAESITNLFDRINILRDLTKNTGLLLESIDEIRANLSAEKKNLKDKLLVLDEKKESLQNTIEEEERKKMELEEKLSSLKEDRQYYEEHLENMMAMIEELGNIMETISQEFKNILESSQLPQNSIEYSISKDGIEIKIYEDVFNDIIEENSNLYEILFSFYPEKIDMEIPEKNIMLEGSFTIREGHIIEYEVKEGKFHDMLLTKGTIDRFFKEGNIYLDLKSILGNSKIQKIQIFDEYIQLTIDLEL